MSTHQGEENSAESSAQSPVDGDKEEKSKEGTTLFGKRFRMNFPKKLGRTSVEVKPAVVDEKAEESDKSEEREEQIIEDNFYGVIQRIRYEYEEHPGDASSQGLPSRIYPSSRNETPLIKPPPHTTIIIQEDRPDSGGVTDIYRGTVSSVGQDADQIEKSGPMWLGDLLLRVYTSLIIPLQEALMTELESNSTQGDFQGLICAHAVPRPATQHCECRWVRTQHPDLKHLHY